MHPETRAKSSLLSVPAPPFLCSNELRVTLTRCPLAHRHAALDPLPPARPPYVYARPPKPELVSKDSRADVCVLADSFVVRTTIFSPRLILRSLVAIPRQDFSASSPDRAEGKPARADDSGARPLLPQCTSASNPITAPPRKTRGRTRPWKRRGDLGRRRGDRAVFSYALVLVSPVPRPRILLRPSPVVPVFTLV